MPNIQAKPIAILAEKLTSGFDYAKTNLHPREIRLANRMVIGGNGQVYYVICREEHLLGLEISDYIIAPGFGKHDDAERITETARTRIR